jgi:hypothetical protein
MAPQLHPHAGVGSVLRDRFRLDTACVEGNPVGYNWLVTDFSDDPDDCLGLVFGSAEQIDVHRRPRKRRLPDPEHQGSLEDEPFSMRRFRQSIEEALQGEVLEELVERTIYFPRPIEEPLVD